MTLGDDEVLLVLAQDVRSTQLDLLVLLQMVQRHLGSELDPDPVGRQVHLEQRGCDVSPGIPGTGGRVRHAVTQNVNTVDAP